ncbi:MAG: glycosyltransferase family 4 protein [Gemmatimonadota bacterium]
MTPSKTASAVARVCPGSAGDVPAGRSAERLPVCLVGPGWLFTSGMSYYTCRLARAMAAQHQVSVILLRRLLPRRCYPGRRRVGQPRARMTYPPGVPVCDGIDWWWGLSLLRALGFLRAQRPAVLALQWWTAAALHTYLLLAVAGRLLGARVVLEVHELQDPGEAGLSLVRGYGRGGLRLLLRLCQGCVLHSDADRRMLEDRGMPLDMPVSISPHGPYDQYRETVPGDPAAAAAIAAVREAPRPAVTNLLFFGVIRPYKGLDDLLAVFSGLSRQEAAGLWLTVVGETWGGCTEPARLIEASPHRDRITFVNSYVPDEVAAAAFGHADVVVLPYHRSASSGPLHVAMSWGLPVVVTEVGGLPEAARGYGGAVFVPPRDTAMLKAGIMRAAGLAGQKFTDPGDWARTVTAILTAAEVTAEGPTPPAAAVRAAR